MDAPAKEDIKQSVEEVLAAKGISLGGDLLFCMIAGSVAFNLSVAGSDRDYFAVYAADVGAALSLTRPAASVDSHEPDLQVYEAARYCELLLKGNPKVVEPLFAEHYTWQAEEWLELKQLRNHVMTQVTIDQYVSYALSQVGDYLKGRGEKPPAKKFYHALRLMREARRILDHGAPRVWFEEHSEEREFLMAIRRNEKDVDDLIRQLLELREDINARKSQLPARTDPQVLSEWLLYLRRKQARVQSLDRSLSAASALAPEDHASLQLRGKAQELLCKFGVEGDILCCVPSGSRAHGLSGPDSSEDYVAVYAAATETVVGLNPPPQRVDELGRDSKQRETYARGLLLFEAGYACQLLAQGNHRLLEALFFSQPPQQEDADSPSLPRFETKAWRALREQAGGGLIAQSTLQHYLGVAQGQLQARPLTRTNLYHALRLLTEAQHILEHRLPPRVTLPADVAASLRRVRAPHLGAGDEQQQQQEAKALDELLQQAKAQVASVTSALAVVKEAETMPVRADRAPLDAWLSHLRLALFAAC